MCCGGIIGMGETWDDRAKMLEVLVNLDPKPESVPLNALVPVKVDSIRKSTINQSA